MPSKSRRTGKKIYEELQREGYIGGYDAVRRYIRTWKEEHKIESNKLEYEINNEIKNKIIRKYFGKKLTITDRADWSTKDILTAYYEQDCIEKIFRDTKETEHFSLRPIFHWTDQKIRVHIFICLLGLMLTAVLQRELQGNGINISKGKLIKYLSQIRLCWVKDNNSSKIKYWKRWIEP